MSYITSNYMSPDNFLTPFIMTRYGTKLHKPGLDYFFKKTQLPFIGEIDLSRFVTDADIKKLESATIKDTLPHRQTAFYKDNVATSSTEIMIAILLGEGLTITVDKNPKAKEIIEKWNDSINARHQTIEDCIKDILHDNLINPGSLWRTFIDLSNQDQVVDLQRVSMQNIKIDEHPTRGWRRFIQVANIPKRLNNESQFYRQDPNLVKEMETVMTIIPDVPECSVYVRLFDAAPVSTVLPFLIYKRWILWFMRKFAEKYWAPFLIGYVGDPSTGYMPPTKKDQDEAINGTLEALRKVRDFGAAAFLGTTKIDVLETNARNANVYVDYLEYMNKEISYGLLSSMGLREGTGRAAATTELVQQGQLRFIRGIRESISAPFRIFYSKVLLPAHGIKNIEPRDIKIGWPEIRTERVDEIMKAVDLGARVGAFRDAREIRKILTPIWAHIDENISDKENKELRDLFLELNSPSRAMGDQPQQRAGGATTGTQGAGKNKKPSKKQPLAAN